MTTRHASFLLVAMLASVAARAHDGHDHDQDAASPSGGTAVATAGGTTGSGDLRFRYNAELSALPPEIASGIKPAHGGFAKTPSGEIYFGLEGTGLIRLSADLREKTIVGDSESLRAGGLHNTTYLERDGGLLVLPDNAKGRVLFVRTDGAEVKTLGRPSFLADGGYAPTDADVAGDGKLYVCDGYGASKTVFTVDLDGMEYGGHAFGGPVPDKGRTEGKFSTNHGVTHDPADGTLLVSDRERLWVQRMTTGGEFVEGIDTGGAPCDADLVEWGGGTLMVVGCLRGDGWGPGSVKLIRDGEVVSTLKPKEDLGLEEFEHIHNAAGVVVEGKLYVLCYGWNPGCYAVLEHVAE